MLDLQVFIAQTPFFNILVIDSFLQVLDLLKTALVSKSTLSDLFINNKPTPRASFVSCDVKSKKDIKFNVTLVIRKADDKVIYALVDKDFADFLLSILTFPLGAVIRLLEGESSVGSMDSLYKSILLLDNKYMKSRDSKKRLANPHLGCQFKLRNQILPISNMTPYYCYYHGDNFRESLVNDCFYITDDFNDGQNCEKLYLVDHSKGGLPGYVKEATTFLVTDGLIFQQSDPLLDWEYFKTFNLEAREVNNTDVTLGIKDVRKVTLYHQ